jgi:hypothetical protein
MEQSIYIRRRYHRTLNTYHLFESFLYGEFYAKVSEIDDTENRYLESLENNNYTIDIDFIYTLFENVWNFSEQIDFNPRLSENLILDILNTSNESDDFFKLTKEFDLFDFDYNVLNQINKYCLNIIIEHGGKMKMKHFFKNYYIFLKEQSISKFRIELLTAEDNICLN